MPQDPPCISPDDITPEIADLSRQIVGLSETGELTLGYLERALVAFTRAVRKDPPHVDH